MLPLLKTLQKNKNTNVFSFCGSTAHRGPLLSYPRPMGLPAASDAGDGTGDLVGRHRGRRWLGPGGDLTGGLVLGRDMFFFFFFWGAEKNIFFCCHGLFLFLMIFMVDVFWKSHMFEVLFVILFVFRYSTVVPVCVFLVFSCCFWDVFGMTNDSPNDIFFFLFTFSLLLDAFVLVWSPREPPGATVGGGRCRYAGGHHPAEQRLRLGLGSWGLRLVQQPAPWQSRTKPAGHGWWSPMDRLGCLIWAVFRVFHLSFGVAKSWRMAFILVRQEFLTHTKKCLIF